jgi:hypothetical protein
MFTVNELRDLTYVRIYSGIAMESDSGYEVARAHRRSVTLNAFSERESIMR